MDKSNTTPQLPYSIVPTTKNDELAVMNFLKKYFFSEEPLRASIRFMEDHASVIKLEKMYAPLVGNGLSMMAVSESGEIMGVRLNQLKCRNDADDEDHDENCDDGPKFNEIVKVWNKVNRAVDVFGRYSNVNRLLILKCVAVNGVYIRQGICNGLYDRTKELALELECQMMYVECGSYFSAKAAERLGFKCVYSFSYSEYVDKQGEVVFKPEMPHEYFKVYLLQL